jgi:hypothetical protein
MVVVISWKMGIGQLRFVGGPQCERGGRRGMGLAAFQ